MMQNTQDAKQREPLRQEDGPSAGCANGMSRADEAERLFRQGYNCSSSVFAAFADTIGLTTDQAAKLSSPFGAGIAGIREVCGAVSGMAMLVGHLPGEANPSDQAWKKALYAEVRAMCHAFEETEGSLICRELLGLKKGETLDEPLVRTEEYYTSRPCVRACRRAAEIAEQFVLDKQRSEAAATEG